MTADQQAAADRKAADTADRKANTSAANETAAKTVRQLSNMGRMRYTIAHPPAEKGDPKPVEGRPLAPPYSVVVTSSHPHMIAVVPDSPTAEGLAASGWLVGQKHGRTQTGVVITAAFTRPGRPVREVKELIDLVDDGAGIPAFPEFGFGDPVAQ